MPGKNSSDNSITDRLIFRQRWWQHILFWGVGYFILFNIFRSSSSFESIDLIYTSIFLVPLAVAVYLNLYLFIPRYLSRERYLVYALLFLLALAAGALFLRLLFDRWIDYILPGYYFISYYSFPELMIFSASFLLITTLLKLSRSWFLLLRVERMTTSHQLMALQSQINPHFLLNSLQTIYALSLEKSDRTPGVILQLSDILKYTLYETAHSSISLEKELDMIKDYVEMYRNRVDPVRADIRMEAEGDPEGLKIAPMMLIPFIENSFKHGLQAPAENSFIHISIRTADRHLHFGVKNSAGRKGTSDMETGKGIGIENTRRRLDLLYPGKYDLKISEKNGIFEVNLHLNLEK